MPGRGPKWDRDPVIVTTLGTSSPYPRPDDPCSSFLLEGGGSRLWIDTGAGSLAALLRYCRLEDLAAVWISHTHADHFSDLAVTFYALRYADISRPPLTVFGPPGWAQRLRGFLTHSARPSPLEDVFDVREVTDRQTVAIGDLELLPVQVHHDVPCFGLRASVDGCVVAYTGDTGPCVGLTDLAAEANLLISEVGYGLAGTEDDPVHLTAAQAGAAALEGQAEQLLLTHLAGANVKACVAAAAATTPGPVIGARPGLVVQVR